MAKRAIVIAGQDNVANLIGAGKKGERVIVEVGDATTECTLAEDIPVNHKFALHPLNKNDDVIKYGYRIGRATREIGVGQHVHRHNIESLRCRADLGSADAG